MTVAKRLSKEGLFKGKLEVARNLLRMQMDINNVAKVTGLDQTRIKQIQNDLK